MPSRVVLAVAITVALAGCFGSGPAGPTGGQTDATSETPTSTYSKVRNDATSTPGTDGPVRLTDPQGPWPGQGTPIVVTAAGTPADVRYFSSNDTIRYVAAWRHANDRFGERGVQPQREPVYEYITPEHWVGFHAPSVAREAVENEIRSRIDVPDPGVSVWASADDSGPPLVARHRTVIDQHGDVRGGTNVSVERLVGVTPQNVTVTIVLDDRNFTRSYPVQVQNVTVRERR